MIYMENNKFLFETIFWPTIFPPEIAGGGDNPEPGPPRIMGGGNPGGDGGPQ